MDTEIWVDCAINDDYQVSSYGNIRNIQTGKYLKPALKRTGYFSVRINKKDQLVHRLVAQAFIPNPNNLPQVNHIDGCKTNNHVSNLEWCTREGNMQHAVKSQLIVNPWGEDHPSHKYDEKTIVRVCEMLQSGDYTKTDISNITAVTYDVIQRIVRRKLWTHTSKNYSFDNIPDKRERYKRYMNSIDRAIISGKSSRVIIETLMEHGMTEEHATYINYQRRKKIKQGKSIVQCTVYIDEGEEIF